MDPLTKKFLDQLEMVRTVADDHMCEAQEGNEDYDEEVHYDLVQYCENIASFVKADQVVTEMFRDLETGDVKVDD